MINKKSAIEAWKLSFRAWKLYYKACPGVFWAVALCELLASACVCVSLWLSAKLLGAIVAHGDGTTLVGLAMLLLSAVAVLEIAQALLLRWKKYEICGCSCSGFFRN